MGASVVDAYWTNEDADTDFQNPTGNDWRLQAEPHNAMGAGNYPGDGSTLDRKEGSAPTSNKPAAGEFHFNLRQGTYFTDSDFLAGVATVGNVAISAGDFLSTLPIAGTFAITGGRCNFMADVAIAGAAGLNGGTIESSLGAYTLTFDAAPTGSGTTIDWANLDVEGTLNLTACTHTNTAATNSLLCDLAGTFNPGGDLGDVAVEMMSNITIATDIACGGFERTAGTLTLTGQPEITVGAGGFVIGVAPTGGYELVMSATTNKFRTYAGVKILTIPAGVVVTASASGGFFTLVGSGTIILGVYKLTFYPYDANALANWSGVITATSGGVQLYMNAALNDPVGDLSVTGGYIKFWGKTANRTLAWTGAIACEDLSVFNETDGFYMHLTVSKSVKATGDLKFGMIGAGKTGSGKLTTDGIVTVGGGVASGDPANTQNAWAMNSSYLQLGGTWTGTGIAVTNDADAVHLEGLGTGDLADVDFGTADAHAHNMTDSGGNSNVDFDEHAPPGSLALCGAGV